MSKRINPRALFGHGLIAPHVYAFKDDPDDPAAPPAPPETGAQPDGGVTQPDAGTRTFTQAEIDRIVAERARREREATERRMLDELGYESIDAARAAQAERKRAAEAKLLEEKKFGEVLEQRDAELARVKAELDTERSKRVDETITRTVLAAASNAGAVSPEEVAMLTRQHFRLGETGAVQVIGPDGQVATNGQGQELTAEAFLRSWLDRHPHHQRAASGQGSGAGASGGGPKLSSGFDPKKRHDPAHLREHRDEIIEKMRSGELKG